MFRQIVGILLGLVASAAVIYGMALYYMALSFDGPGSLTDTEAIKWIALASGTILGGFAVGYLVVHKLVRAHRATTLVMLPGLAVSAYFLKMVVEQAFKLASY